MDYFKRQNKLNTGPGGLLCRCCNPFMIKKRGKDNPNKKRLARLARRQINQKDRQSFYGSFF